MEVSLSEIGRVVVQMELVRIPKYLLFDAGTGWNRLTFPATVNNSGVFLHTNFECYEIIR